MKTPDVAVIGSGPAGLFAAELLSAAGHEVTVFDRMPSPARKFLMAGRGGLNLTHTEDLPAFVARYGTAANRLGPMIAAFPPAALRAWAEGLGEETFVGTSGRVFPRAMKASPLLRAWLGRLAAQGVRVAMRHEWRGIARDGKLLFERQGEPVEVRPCASLLALGGASWARLGSDGQWADILRAHGVALAPFRPANCGFVVPWGDAMARHAGGPLKGIAVAFEGKTAAGEAVITTSGLEGGAIYALAALLREAIEARGEARIAVDLRPLQSEAALAARLEKTRRGESLANTLRKTLRLSPAAAALLREGHGEALSREPSTLARQIKAVPVRLTAPAPIDRAISVAGGVAWEAADEGLQLHALPGVYVAGEMLDWEAPTGGYLLQATFATAAWAASAIAARLNSR